MIVIAALIDGAQFILTLVPLVGWIASWILSICAWFLFGIWFYHKGVNLFAASRALGTFGAMLGEATPFINAFPWWTARVFVAVRYEWRRESAV